MDDHAELNQIIADCRKGSNEAFSKLIDLYASRCYGYFYRLCGNREISNDLLSELFLKIVKKIGSFKGGSFESWLFTTASNIFRDYLRQEYRRKKILEIESKKMRINHAITTKDNEMSDDLQLGLKRLDPETAELLMLRFYGELSFKEIADMRSQPIGTVLSKVHRGLKKLKEIMENNEK